MFVWLRSCLSVVLLCFALLCFALFSFVLSRFFFVRVCFGVQVGRVVLLWTAARVVWGVSALTAVLEIQRLVGSTTSLREQVFFRTFTAWRML